MKPDALTNVNKFNLIVYCHYVLTSFIVCLHTVQKFGVFILRKYFYSESVY